MVFVIERGMKKLAKLGDNIKYHNGFSFLPEELIFIKRKKRKNKNNQ